MRKFTIKAKITIWFSALIIIVATVLFAMVIFISDTVIINNVKDALIETVSANAEEIEYHAKYTDSEKSDDLYIEYLDAYIVIENDFLNMSKGVYTALYDENGNLLYGEDFISAGLDIIEPNAGKIQTIKTAHGSYYAFDVRLTGAGLDGLWLRGSVSSREKNSSLSAIVNLSVLVIPWIVILAIAGGYFLAGRMLAPINMIRKTAEEISGGSDLSRRIGLKNGNDEVHQLADTFDSMLERLEKSFNIEKQFTSDVSHELRTPLAVILAQCEYALEEPAGENDYIEALESIQRQGNRMSDFINDILEFTRIEQGRADMSMEKLNFSNLVAEICDEMSVIKEKNISINTEIEPNIEITGNRALLTRVLNNLISNAYKYGKENGYIKVELYTREDRTLLSVTDDGIGIPEDKIDKIFDRFYRADDSRNTKGTGLGLTIVKEIADLHKARIAAESIEGAGSKFSFII